MQTEITEKGRLKITCDAFDLCSDCKKINVCPLIQAITQEIVILHYAQVAIQYCGLYQKKR